jgi:hypothetical protein
LHLADDMAHITAALTKLVREHPDLRKGKRPLLLRRAIRLLDRLRDDLASQDQCVAAHDWVSFSLPPLLAQGVEGLLFQAGVSIGSRDRNKQLLAALATSTAATEYSPASGVGVVEQVAKVFGPEALPPKVRERLETPTAPTSSTSPT